MYKIIFTDIDGVLNSHLSNKTAKVWKKSCIDEYNRIVAETDAVCVVTSTWRVRRQSVKELQELFIQHGLDVEVVGFTPVLSEDRGFEIETWLAENKTAENYVILDDNMSAIDTYYNLKNFVKTVGYIGLTKEDADKAIKMLNDK